MVNKRHLRQKMCTGMVAEGAQGEHVERQRQARVQQQRVKMQNKMQ